MKFIPLVYQPSVEITYWPKPPLEISPGIPLVDKTSNKLVDIVAQRSLTVLPNHATGLEYAFQHHISSIQMKRN
jgi:hypothetical protein